MDVAPLLESLDADIAAHEAEITKLRTAREAIAVLGSNGTAPTTTRTSASKSPGRPAGSGGNQNRADQAYDIVAANPGVTIPEIAAQMGIEANYLYRVMPKLASAKRVKKQGKGWAPVVS